MGKTMSIVIKNKLSATALALCSVLALGYTSQASAQGAQTAEFSTDITVISDLKCDVKLSQPAGTKWSLGWTLEKASDMTGSLDYNGNPTDPLTVQVVFDEADPSCDLSGMGIGATVVGPNVTPAAQPGYFLKETPRGAGSWRYAPVLAKVIFYTDDGETDADDGVLTVTDANNVDHQQSKVAKYHAHDDITALVGMNHNPAVSLSDNFFDDSAEVLLAGSQLVKIKNDTPAIIRSAVIGVSAIIAKDPEDKAGTTDVSVVDNTDVINLPFTLNIAYK